jgi:hypothetical protein
MVGTSEPVNTAAFMAGSSVRMRRSRISIPKTRRVGIYMRMREIIRCGTPIRLDEHFVLTVAGPPRQVVRLRRRKHARKVAARGCINRPKPTAG